MAYEPRQFDEQGLPIPQKFVDYRPQDDEASKRPKISMPAKRLVVLIIIAALVVPIVFGPKIISAGRETLARWLSSRAETKLQMGDTDGALADADQAIRWDPNAWKAYKLRGAAREKLNQLEKSLADFDKSIELLEARGKAMRNRWRNDRSGELIELYMQRSWVNVRLTVNRQSDRKREAISDATEAVNRLSVPPTLNARAYARAVLGIELKEALDDIDRALAGGLPNNADLRDTRGYILHLLGRNEEAVTELDRAIQNTQFERGMAVGPNLAAVGENSEKDHALAVMIYHRGLARRALGHKEEAEADLDRAKQLGYSRENGVF